MADHDRTERQDRAGRRGVPGGANAASNGYWLHDDLGPRAYVGPGAAAADGRDIASLLEDIEDQLALLPEAETRQLHVAAVQGRIVLSGTVGSAEARRRVGAHVVTAAGEVPVENRLDVART